MSDDRAARTGTPPADASADTLRIAPDGWMSPLRRRASPNFDARPPGAEITLVVVHNISLPPGVYGGGQVERLFTNALATGIDPFIDRLSGVRVSSHFVVDRAGAATQFVSCLDRAWHAGASSFRGRTGCNDWSIGIELEGSDFEPYTVAQYATLNRLLAALAAAYPLEAIAGHSDIAPGRKTDPGPFFEWQRLALPARVHIARG